MSFLVLKRIRVNSEEDQYFILPNCSLVIELQFGTAKFFYLQIKLKIKLIFLKIL
jgi:hypothetical protein